MDVAGEWSTNSALLRTYKADLQSGIVQLQNQQVLQRLGYCHREAAPYRYICAHDIKE